MKKGFITTLLLFFLTTSALAAPTNTSGPWGIDASPFSSLSAALSSSATAGKTIVVSKPMSIDNQTVSGSRLIKVIQGGSINVSSGKLLTFATDSKFEAGKYQVFGGAGQVVFANGTVYSVPPEWFGKSASKVKWYNNTDSVDNGYALQKIKQVVVPGAYPYMDTMTESPMVWWDDDQKYHMIFTAYSNATGTMVASHGHATSLDLVNWTPDATSFFTASGTSGSPDEKGVTGPYIIKRDGTYYLFYIGLTGVGYEAGTKSLCLATSLSLSGPWTRHGVVIANGTSGTASAWRDVGIWHPSIVEKNGMFYVFFNASGHVGGVSRERIGYATSKDLLTWTVDDINSPLIDGVTSSWHDPITGDPSVYYDGTKWVMHFFGYNGTNAASDGIAISGDESFPLNWTLAGSNPILTPTPGGYDSLYAHKPFIYFLNGDIYHFYTAVSTDTPTLRSIGLAVSSRRYIKNVYSTDHLLQEVAVPYSSYTVLQRLTSSSAPQYEYTYDTTTGKLKWERTSANGYVNGTFMEIDPSTTGNGGVTLYGKDGDPNTLISTAVVGSTGVRMESRAHDAEVNGQSVILKSNNFWNGSNHVFTTAAPAYQLVLGTSGLYIKASTNTPVAGATITWAADRPL